MPKSWSELAAGSEMYVETDFQAAAYQLMSEQVLYWRFPQQRVSYELVNRYRQAFMEAAGLFGMELRFVDEDRYVAAIPRQMKKVATSLQQTLLVLTLRRAHHEKTKAGEAEFGAVTITIEDLQVGYAGLSGRDDLPTQAVALREALAPIKRHGMIRIAELDRAAAQPFAITILPAIETLVSEAVMARMAGAYNADVADTGSGVDDDESESAEEGAGQ